MSSQAVLEPTVASPPFETFETADDHWARWIEKGQAHDRVLRRRWIEALGLAGAVLLLGTAIIVGLR
jgi:hypothetical protein